MRFISNPSERAALKLQGRTSLAALQPLRDASSCQENACQFVLDRHNDRLKLLDARPYDFESLEPSRARVGKVIVYSRPGSAPRWHQLGLTFEGSIAGFFRDGTEARLWAAYLKEERRQEGNRDELDVIARLAGSRRRIPFSRLPPGYVSELAWGENAPEIARLLGQTFSDYPDSLQEADIQLSIRRRDKLYRLIRRERGPLVSVASAEIDRVRLCAEMTDCATSPEHRGKGLMAYLLAQLELDVLRWSGIVHLYTLARAGEIGMNCVFAKLGYRHSGCLVNNCRMPGGWESMNIWHKRST